MDGIVPTFKEVALAVTVHLGESLVLRNFEIGA